MMTSSLTVVKVGGSLFDWPELPCRLGAFLDWRRSNVPPERIVLLAGGGPAADLVRMFDRSHGLGPEPAHQLALRALDLTASLLAALVPSSVSVDGIESLHDAWSSRLVPILAPRKLLNDVERARPDPLPASWDVTSDAISARLADHLDAHCLILLKSAPLRDAANRREAVHLGLVDPMFCNAARTLARVEYLNLREPSLETRLLPCP
jgi:aspartokinase-like uncharacterized kinase